MKIKEKKSKKLSGIVILIIGFLVISTGCLYFLSLDNNDNNKDKDGNQNQSQIEVLSIVDKIVKELYDNIGKSDPYYDEPMSYYPYRNELVTYKDLSKTYIARIILQGIDEDTEGVKSSPEGTDDVLNYVTIPISVFNKILKEKFGNVADFTMLDLKEALNGSVYTDHSLICTPLGVVENNILCTEYRAGGITVGSWNYTEIIKAEKDDNNIYLYDKFMAKRDDKYYFSSTEMVTTTGGDDEITAPLETIEKYTDRIHTYKHKFTKDANGNYYYVSTEMVK